jgi:hypothetical protein
LTLLVLGANYFIQYSIADKFLSPKKNDNTENQEAGLKALGQFDYSKLKEKTTKEEENVENTKQDKGLSLEKDSQYILRLLFLSLFRSEKNEVKRNKQNSSETFDTSSSPFEISKINEQKVVKQNLDDEKTKLEREKFISELKEKEINPPQNLLSLLKIATVEQLNNLRRLLNENKTITNPIGFLIKALKNNWQPNKSSSVKTAKTNLSRKTASNQPHWRSEFDKFYELAIATGYCQDLPFNWLPTNHRHEPMVRLTQPDEYLRIPYTLMYWRTAKEEFESLYPHLSIENWSAET